VSNIDIVNIDTGSVVLQGDGFADGVLHNAALTTQTYAAGTILARTTADGKFGAFDPAGAGGLEIPKAVLTYELADVPTVTDAAVRVLTAGIVNSQRLIIHAGGTVTPGMLDALRDYSIVPVYVKQLAMVDNPQP
jgi:hypothetical protein